MKEIDYYYSQARPEIAAFIPESVKTILDIGCGEGAFLKLIKKNIGAETWGLEVVNEIAIKAKANVDQILVGKIENTLDLIPDAYFDCITFNDVLEHLVEPTKVLTMIKPKLKDRGIIVASIPNVRDFFTLYELVIKKDWQYKDFGVLDSTHLRFFTKKSMKRMFDEAGYKIIKQEGINGIDSFKFEIFNLVTFHLFADTRYCQFACIAQKNNKI